MMKVDVNLGAKVSLGRPEALFDFQFMGCAPIRGYGLRRDSRRFLFTRVKQRPGSVEITRLNLVQNWLEELKRLCPTK